MFENRINSLKIFFFCIYKNKNFTTFALSAKRHIVIINDGLQNQRPFKLQHFQLHSNLFNQFLLTSNFQEKKLTKNYKFVCAIQLTKLICKLIMQTTNTTTEKIVLNNMISQKITHLKLWLITLSIDYY